MKIRKNNTVCKEFMQTKKLKANKLTFVATFVLLLTLSSFTAVIPTAFAQTKFETRAFMSVNPHTIGVNQILLLNPWVHPQPGDFQFHTGVYNGLQVIFTKPDGTIETIGPIQSEQSGTFWIEYKPTVIGTWSVKLVFPGDQWHLPSESPPTTFIVQADPVQIGFPPVPLPTGYWTSPINSDNREWYQISGPWLKAPADRFQPYSTSPKSAHIVWRAQASLGGIVGGNTLSLSAGAGGGAPPVILMGRVYYNMPGGTFRCVDLRTGGLIWEKSGGVTIGVLGKTGVAARPGEITSESEALNPLLWRVASGTWTQYEAFYGTTTGTTVTGVPVAPGNAIGFKLFFLGDISYAVDQQGNYSGFNLPYRNTLMKINLTKPGSTFANKLEWNVTLPDDVSGSTSTLGTSFHIFEDIGIIGGADSRRLTAWNLTTGQMLWSKYVDYTLSNTGISAYGKFVNFDLFSMKFVAYDFKTGTQLWKSEAMDYPWGAQGRVMAAAYGLVYVSSYDGTVRALDANTGQTIWKFFTGNNTETPYETWSPYLSCVVADGKLFFGTSEHTPTEPRARGNSLFALDAYTGTQLWKISGAIGASALAEGYLIGNSENDGYQYCFGKGLTATTISAPENAIPASTPVLLQGTVTDQSPGQPNTPAISDESMNLWMDYLYMQKPMPTNATGVKVHLTAIDPNGNYQDIGNATSDAKGYYSTSWKPPVSGVYKITATFDGSDSYFSSNAETSFLVANPLSSSPVVAPTPTQTLSPTHTPTVSPTPTSTAATPPSTYPPSTTYIAIAAAVIIIVVAVAALILRKRK